MAPFSTTKVISTGWSAHHQSVVLGAMNAAVTITDPTRTTPGTFDPDTGTYGPPTPHYIVGGPADTNPDWRGGVPCRIQRLKDDRAVLQADQSLVVRMYLLQLPANVPDIEVGYTAVVKSAINDAHLVGQELEATDVMHGSERFNRDVIWVHNQQDLP